MTLKKKRRLKVIFSPALKDLLNVVSMTLKKKRRLKENIGDVSAFGVKISVSMTLKKKRRLKV